MSKRLYTGFSFYQFLLTLFLRLICVFVLIYSLPHYEENPVIIIIVAVLCILFILFIGDDQIIVYNDKITQTTNSISSLILNKKDKTYLINTIKSAYLETPIKSSTTEIGVAILIYSLLPKVNQNKNKTQPIFFLMKNGGTEKIDTNLELSKLKKIEQIVNSLTK